MFSVLDSVRSVCFQSSQLPLVFVLVILQCQVQCHQSNSKIDTFNANPRTSEQQMSAEVSNDSVSHDHMDTLDTQANQRDRKDNLIQDQISAELNIFQSADQKPVPNILELSGGSSSPLSDNSKPTSNMTDSVPPLQKSQPVFSYPSFFMDQSGTTRSVRISPAQQALASHDAGGKQDLHSMLDTQASLDTSVFRKHEQKIDWSDIEHFLQSKEGISRKLMIGNGVLDNILDSGDSGFKACGTYLTQTQPLKKYVSNRFGSFERPPMDLGLNVLRNNLFNENVHNPRTQFSLKNPETNNYYNLSQNIPLAIQRTLQQTVRNKNLASTMDKYFAQYGGSPLMNFDKAMKKVEQISQTPFRLHPSLNTYLTRGNDILLDPYINQNHNLIQSKISNVSDNLNGVRQNVCPSNLFANNVTHLMKITEPRDKLHPVDISHNGGIVTAERNMEKMITTCNINTNGMTNKEWSSDRGPSKTNNDEVVHLKVNDKDSQYLQKSDPLMDLTNGNVYNKIRTLIGSIGNGTNKLMERFDQIIRSKEVSDLNKKNYDGHRMDSNIGSDENVYQTKLNESLPNDFVLPIAKKAQSVSNTKTEFRRPFLRDTSPNQPVKKIQVHTFDSKPFSRPKNIYHNKRLPHIKQKDFDHGRHKSVSNVFKVRENHPKSVLSKSTRVLRVPEHGNSRSRKFKTKTKRGPSFITLEQMNKLRLQREGKKKMTCVKPRQDGQVHRCQVGENKRAIINGNRKRKMEKKILKLNKLIETEKGRNTKVAQQEFSEGEVFQLYFNPGNRGAMKQNISPLTPEVEPIAHKIRTNNFPSRQKTKHVTKTNDGPNKNLTEHVKERFDLKTKDSTIHHPTTTNKNQVSPNVLNEQQRTISTHYNWTSNGLSIKEQTAQLKESNIRPKSKIKCVEYVDQTPRALYQHQLPPNYLKRQYPGYSRRDKSGVKPQPQHCDSQSKTIHKASNMISKPQPERTWRERSATVKIKSKDGSVNRPRETKKILMNKKGNGGKDIGVDMKPKTPNTNSQISTYHPYQDSFKVGVNLNVKKHLESSESDSNSQTVQEEIESKRKHIKKFSKIQTNGERMDHSEDKQLKNNNRKDRQGKFQRQKVQVTSSNPLQFVPITQADYDNVIDGLVNDHVKDDNQINQDQMPKRPHTELLVNTDMKELMHGHIPNQNIVHNLDKTKTSKGISLPSERFYEQNHMQSLKHRKSVEFTTVIKRNKRPTKQEYDRVRVIQHPMKYDGRTPKKQRSRIQLKTKEMNNAAQYILREGLDTDCEIDDEINVTNRKQIELILKREYVQKHLDHIISMVNEMKEKQLKTNKKLSPKRAHAALQYIKNEKPVKVVRNLKQHLKENLTKDSQERELMEKDGKDIIKCTPDMALRTKLMDNIKKLEKKIEDNHTREKVYAGNIDNAPIHETD